MDYSVGASNNTYCTQGTNIKTMTYGTGGDGNIDTKSDVGTYYYNGTPHAVSSITTNTGVTVDGVTNPKFYYDADGNMQCVTTHSDCTSMPARTYSWTSFDMVEQVAQGTNTATFTYTPEHQRITQTTSTGVTLYANDPVGGVMSERFAGGSTITWRTCLMAYGRIVAERFSQGSTVSMLYFVGDHLGSTAALTGTGSPPPIQEQDSYDAWGKRRNDNGTDNANCSITSATLRGYTGQEMMDSFCLVNLNGRIYDPSIGRFLSADPGVPRPMNSQSFNRYSYTESNPLSFVDPSGYTGYQVDGCTGTRICYMAQSDGTTYNPTGDTTSTYNGGSDFVWGGEGIMFLGAIGAWGNAGMGGLPEAVYHPFLGSIGAPSGGWFIVDSPGTYTCCDANGGEIENVPAEVFPDSSYAPIPSGGLATNGGWFEPTSTFAGGVGVLSDVGRYSAGASTLGINLHNIFNSKIYLKGWDGNQYVWATGIADAAESLGRVSLGVGVALDFYGAATGQISSTQLSVDLTVDAIGAFGGLPGAAFAGTYYGLQTFYPGGAAGALNEYGNLIQENQAIDPSLVPFEFGKMSFHPRQNPGSLAPPAWQKKQRYREVIDPDDLPARHEKKL